MCFNEHQKALSGSIEDMKSRAPHPEPRSLDHLTITLEWRKSGDLCSSTGPQTGDKHKVKFK